jgi:hypothetical protein
MSYLKLLIRARIITISRVLIELFKVILLINTFLNYY